MRKLFLTVFISLITSALLLSGCSGNSTKPASKVEITVSAAASLNDALTKIKSNYEKKHKNITISLNLGGSGALEQQILQGAPADLFISAGEKQFNDLQQKGLIDSKKNTNLLKNQLVLVTNKSKPANLTSFADLVKDNVNKVAIGTPEAVPAGLYAMQTLQHEGIWDALNSKDKLVRTKDVRQVLTFVETGNVDAGIVYMTDAKVSKKVKIIASAKENTHEPITYPTGVIKASKHHAEANDFFDYLTSKDAKTVFEQFGFEAISK